MTFRRQLCPFSAVEYIIWRLIPGGRPIWLKLRTGAEIELRRRGQDTTNNDYGVAYEVFVEQHYRPPFPISKREIRYIVDLGANVGYASLYLMSQYPSAELLALEPHANFFSQLQKHVVRNGLQQRCDLWLAAAGTSEGVAALSDAGSSSRLLSESAEEGRLVRVVDFFERVGGKPIDILKIDIEGAEFSLLADRRFFNLDARYVALEWHESAGQAGGRAYCAERLRQSGYEVFETIRRKSHGMLWARKCGALD